MSVKLSFEGYWDVKMKQNIPSCKGIYVVFASDYQKDSLLAGLLRVLYIDSSKNINQTISNNENILNWSKELHYNEQLLFSLTRVNDKLPIEDIKDQLIFANQPVLNKAIKSVPNNQINIKCSGMYYGLKQCITIK
jgi:hypothetical protein